MSDPSSPTGSPARSPTGAPTASQAGPTTGLPAWLTDQDLDDYLHTAITAAREAGRVQIEEAGSDLQVGTKSTDSDLVTRVDSLSEERIRQIVQAAHPDHVFVGEEGSYDGAGKGQSGADERFRWIVDPIDGTVNYAHGFPFYCASIALEVEGVMVVGVVFDPTRDELFSAVNGRGATLNGAEISVSGASALNQALVATGFAYDVPTRLINLELFGKVLPVVRGVRRAGAAALDICYVACGRLDAFWELQLQPWDMAAATLILREAGGSTSGADGLPHVLTDELLVATNGALHGKLLDLLGVVDLRA